MTKSDLKGESYVADHGEESYVQLVAAYSLAVGVASILLSVAGFGSLAQSVPKPVRVGFKWGCAVGVLLSALPNGFFQFGGNDLKKLVADSTLINIYIARWRTALPGLYNVAQCFYGLFQPWLWSPSSSLMFIAGTAFIMEGSKRFLPSSFPPGTDVILVTMIAALYSYYTHYEGATVGEIPSTTFETGTSFWDGQIKIPFEILDIRKLVAESKLLDQFDGSYILLAASSFMFAMVNFISIMGIATGFESEDGIQWSADRELFAQGTSCAMAALVGSAPVSGSLSRSLVSRMTGTTSQLACIVTALCWIYLLPYMKVLSPTPKAALSAVIVSAVLKGIAIPKDLLQLSGWDGITGWSTGLITAISTPTKGFCAGFILHHLLRLLRTTAATKIKNL
jgi:MFS superfamily sulfate permease-like transporter